MKTNTYILVFVFLCTMLNVFPQDKSAKTNSYIIKTNIALPLTAIVVDYKYYSPFNYKAISLTPEFCFKSRQSVQLTGTFISYYKNSQNQDKYFLIVPEYKYFLNKKKEYAGFYTGPYLKAIFQHSKDNEVSCTTSACPLIDQEFKQFRFGAGAILGYQSYIKNKIVLDFIFGMGYTKDITTTIIKPRVVGGKIIDKGSVDFRLAINIGYKF